MRLEGWTIRGVRTLCGEMRGRYNRSNVRVGQGKDRAGQDKEIYLLHSKK
jgi:hypothetical protein